ncbi:unnamed protein product [Auanema sp. JU1783]|nr:unnamed protein product [Auanema sp. JU1783]
MCIKTILLLSLLVVITSAMIDTIKRNPSLLDYLKSPMLMGYAPIQEYNKELPNLQYLMYLRDPPRSNSILTFP